MYSTGALSVASKSVRLVCHDTLRSSGDIDPALLILILPLILLHIDTATYRYYLTDIDTASLLLILPCVIDVIIPGTGAF